MSRPRWKIALYCPDEARRSVLAFALNTRLPAAAICCESHADLISILYRHDSESGFNEIRCVIVVHASQHDIRTVLFRMNRRFDVPVILVGKLSQTHRQVYATQILPPSVETIELLQAVRNVSARKRGPKRSSPENKQIARISA